MHHRLALPQRRGLRMFGRTTALQGRAVSGELDHYSARAQLSLGQFTLTGAGEKARTILSKSNSHSRLVGLVALRIGNVDGGDPVSPSHFSHSPTERHHLGGLWRHTPPGERDPRMAANSEPGAPERNGRLSSRLLLRDADILEQMLAQLFKRQPTAPFRGQCAIVVPEPREDVSGLARMLV